MHFRTLIWLVLAGFAISRGLGYISEDGAGEKQGESLVINSVQVQALPFSTFSEKEYNLYVSLSNTSHSLLTNPDQSIKVANPEQLPNGWGFSSNNCISDLTGQHSLHLLSIEKDASPRLIETLEFVPAHYLRKGIPPRTITLQNDVAKVVLGVTWVV